MHSAVCLDNKKRASKIDAAKEIRVEKVLQVRRQLHTGRYPVAARLDVAADRLLEDLLQ